MASSTQHYTHGQWTSRLVFVFAATGSAVGLGNIWKFPYMAGENGGSSFILIYLACVAFIALPILSAELLIGRHGKRSPVNVFQRFHRDYGTPPVWRFAGWLGVLAGFLILSYYSVIAGWVIAYVFQAGAGAFANATADSIASNFNDLVSDPERLTLWHTFFMILTVAVLMRGIHKGIERVVKYFMPLLLALILALIFYNFFVGDMARTMGFMFSFDFGKVTGETVLVALGQAFFSLSLGMGAMMIYGSYLPDSAPLFGTAAVVAFADTLVALLAGLMIFPLLFAFGMEPAQGVGLIFKTLPLAFSQMPGGIVFGTLFFFLLLIAAWTSALSLLEPIIAWAVEHLAWSRVKAAVTAGVVAWLIGLGTVFSFNLWQNIQLWDKTVFDLLDYLTSNIMLPLGGLLIVLFVGWMLPGAAVRAEAGFRSERLYRVWRALVRWIAPAAVLLILFHLLGWEIVQQAVEWMDGR